MKNQNDLIFSIVAFLVMLIAILVSYFTKRQPAAPAAPPQVNISVPSFPEGSVVMANALPNASSNQQQPGGSSFGAGANGAGSGSPSLTPGGGGQDQVKKNRPGPAGTSN